MSLEVESNNEFKKYRDIEEEKLTRLFIVCKKWGKGQTHAWVMLELVVWATGSFP